MSSEITFLLNGRVESIRSGEITLIDTTFNGNALGFTYKIKGSHPIAELNPEEGDFLELEAPIEASDFKTKIIIISKVKSAKKIHTTPKYFVAPKVYNTDYGRNPLLEIPDLSVEEILGKDHPYLESIKLNFNKGYPYRKNFEKGMNIVSEIKGLSNDYAYNALKSTRVGATTNVNMSGLVQGLKTLVFVPNNSVMDAVEEAYMNFVELTGDDTKTFRKLQSNEQVCVRAQAKIEKNGAASELPFLMRGNCKTCGIESVVTDRVADVIYTDKKIDQRVFGKESEISKIQLHPTLPEGDNDHCQQKAMVDELLYLKKEGFELAYDLTVITFEKALALMKSDGKIAELLLEVIANADLLLFDEFGQYLAKQEQGVVVWERREMIDTTAKEKKKKGKRRMNKKVSTPTPTNIHENLKEIEEAMNRVDGFNYQLLKPIFNEFLDKTKDIIEEKRTFRRIRNPLISAEYGDKRFYDLTGKKILPGTKMIEVLEHFFWNSYSKFENGIDSENKNEFKYLVSLMMVLMSEDVVFHHSENTTWIKNKKTKDQEQFKIETLRLLPGDDVLVQNINQLIGRNQKVIFTDATTPPFRFNSLERSVKNVMFGDPLGTNKKLLVIQDRTLWKFDNTRWHKGGKNTKKSKGYKARVIDKLMSVIENLGGKNIKIWAPNKDIAREFVVLINKRKRNLSCTPTHTSVNSRVVVDWMRSSGTRGVESNRRVHIIVGNPDVPKSAYEYLAFMYPDYFDTIPEQVLAEVGRKYNVSLDKIREIIGTFHTPEFIGNVSYRKETPDAIEAELISIISDQLRISFVGSDGWQGGSRAKDPEATDPSVLYLLGWNEQAALNMIQWGYDLQILGGRKNITDRATIIAPPIVIQGGVEDADEWMAGKERDPTHLLSKDFSELPRAISYLLAYEGKSVTSKQIWPNISPNLQVGYDSENHRNGFFVAYNRCFTSDSIQITETSPGEFIYDYGSSAGIDIPDRELVFKILLTAYRSNKEEVKVEDILRNNRWDKQIKATSVKREIKIIKEYGLLKGSSWGVEQYKSRGKKHSKIVKNKPLSDDVG